MNYPDCDPLFDAGAYSDGVMVDLFLFISGKSSVDFKT